MGTDETKARAPESLLEFGSLPQLSGADWLDGVVDEAEQREPPPAPHLEVVGALGMGGMGEVLRVFDHRLRRTMAMKVLRHHLAARPDIRARFVEEAQATAQLTHPGIIPVHELGTLPDGRPYFTMKEVEGTTLADVMAAGQKQRLRRLIGLLARVCEIVGYAHSRGVIHRDLKPLNIMVGAFGEVLVLDWGLVKISQAAGQTAAVHTDRQEHTLLGQVSGTPRYMSPEQARGDSLDARSDVYSLGVMLFEILAGRPLQPQRTPTAVMEAVAHSGARVALPGGLPPELAAICRRAVERAPADRFADAAAMGQAIVDWLDGEQARQRALAVVAQALALEAPEARLRQEAAVQRARAQQALRDLPPSAPPEARRPGWLAEDQAKEAEQRADHLQLQRLQQLTAALTHCAELPEALSALAAHHRRAQAAAEEAADVATARHHAQQLAFYDRGEHTAWLAGHGALTLRTSPPGATVTLHRYILWDRRLVPGPGKRIGTTPIDGHRLSMGSYLLIIEADGFETVRYPIHITRQHHWDGVPPGGSAPLPIPLPPAGALGPDDVYVPAGWMIAGGGNSLSKPRHLAWADGFVIRRHPVTNAEYMRFLDTLVGAGREHEALRWVPRGRATRPDEPGAMAYGRDAAGRFVLVPDAEGDVWHPQWPAVMVSWEGAMAYAAAEGWTLPLELWWEKAARGVDGRLYPWGNVIVPAYLNTRERGGRPLPAVVSATPEDVSPYGMRGAAGNVRDWMLEPFSLPDGPANPDERGLRGGCFFSWANTMACRVGIARTVTADSIGFRIACQPAWITGRCAPQRSGEASAECRRLTRSAPS